LVPVKAFDRAKERLSPSLSIPDRARIAARLGRGVVEASAPLPVAVACDDVLVARWAEALGARVIWVEARGLNAAVSDGLAHLARRGIGRAIVAHGDLARPAGLARVHLDGYAEGNDVHPGVTLVPDLDRRGTNVMVTPTRPAIECSYGPGSFQRHLRLAADLGLPVRVLDDPDLGFDVDLPSHLAALDAAPVPHRPAEPSTPTHP